MTTEMLQGKVSRYLRGHSKPSEKRQLQTWLSDTGEQQAFTEEDRIVIEAEILSEIQAHTAYPLFFPKTEPWWKKITAFL